MFEEIVMFMIKGIKSCPHAGFKGMVFGLRGGDMIMFIVQQYYTTLYTIKETF